MNIRSLLLSEMPPDLQTVRCRTLILRWIITALITTMIVLLIYATVKRVFAVDEPAGQALYGFHDHVFLVIRGEIFALLLYPFSFIVLFAVIYLVLFSLIPWLIARSVLRGLYIVFWSSLVGRIRLHKWVLRLTFLSRVMTVWLRFIPFLPSYRADTPRTLVQNQREQLRLTIWTTGDTHSATAQHAVKRFIAMLKLGVQLEVRVSKRHRHIDTQLQSWHMALLLLQFNNAPIEHLREMITIVQLLPLRQIIDATPANMPDSLKPSTLIARLTDLLSLYRHAPIYPSKLLNRVSMIALLDNSPDLNVQQPSCYDVVTRLVEWVENCITLYNDITYHLQSYVFQRVEPPPWRALPPSQNMPLSYTMIGQLIIQMATHVALITRQVQPAQALLEAHQSLTLALDTAQVNKSLRPDGKHWLALVAGASQPDIGELMYPYETFGIIAYVQSQLEEQQRDNDTLKQILSDPSLLIYEQQLKQDKLINRMGPVS